MNKLDRFIDESVKKVLNELLNNDNGFNIKNVYHFSDYEFDMFDLSKTKFGYFFFADNPNTYSDRKYGYVCDLRMDKPFVCNVDGANWSYPLWRYVADNDGGLIPENELTEDKYDGLLGLPFILWQHIYYDEEEYEVDEIPELVKKYLSQYDGVIIKNIDEYVGRGDCITDYCVFSTEQIKIKRRIK